MRKLVFSVPVTLGLLLGLPAWPGEKGWFGLAINVDVEAFSLNPTLRTVKIESVVPSSPAASAGLASGDIVLQVQGIAIAGAKADVLKNAMQKSVGEKLQLKFQRGSEAPREAVLVAAPRPSER
jgi:C-terminal processing protease CtpA/Prc